MDAFIGIGKMHQSDAEHEKEAGSMRGSWDFPVSSKRVNSFRMVAKSVPL